MAAEKTQYKGRLLHIVTRTMKLPNGRTAAIEMVKHPGAVVIVPFLSKDKLILLRQFRPVISSYIYELPAGTLEKNESPLACAKREVIEETGYAAKKMTKLGEIIPVPGYSTEKIILFKAEGLTEKGSCCEEDEIIETKIVTRGEISRLFKSKKIVDAKTICGLSMCGWL